MNVHLDTHIHSFGAANSPRRRAPACVGAGMRVQAPHVCMFAHPVSEFVGLFNGAVVLCTQFGG